MKSKSNSIGLIFETYAACSAVVPEYMREFSFNSTSKGAFPFPSGVPGNPPTSVSRSVSDAEGPPRPPWTARTKMKGTGGVELQIPRMLMGARNVGAPTTCAVYGMMTRL